MKRPLGVLAAAAIVLAPARAAGEAGLTAVPFLGLPVGARSTAMGGAFTAVEGGVESLFYNPAGLAAEKRPAMSATFASGLTDDVFGSVSAAAPTRFGTFAVGALYLDGGNIDLNLSSGLQATEKAEQDLTVLGAWATRLPGGLSVGATGKWIQSRLVEAYSAQTWAVDAGFLWRTPLNGLDVGASVLNLGNDLTFEQQGDPLPLTFRAGAAYRRDWDKSLSWLLAVDGVSVKDEDPRAIVGGELTSRPGAEDNAYSFRAGWQFGRDQDSLTLGAGAAFSHFSLDYSYSLARDLNASHRFTLGCRF